MAEGVVDVLEVVQVQEHHRHRALAALRQRERVLHPVAEQVAVGEERQRIMEGELAQLLFQRLALADVAEVERQALDRRVLRQVAADAFDDVTAVAALDAQLHRADCAGGRRRHLGEEGAQLLPILPAPQVVQVASDQRLGLQSQRALTGRRHEAHHPVAGDDHDHVRGVGDERGVAVLDDARRLALAHQRVPAQHDALAHHEQQREGEHHHGHDRGRAADVAAAEVHQHEKGREHGRVRERARERIRGAGHAAHRGSQGAHLLASGDGDRHVAAQIQHVLELPGQVVTAHLGERPENVAEEHGGKAGQKQQRHPPAAGEQQHAEHQEQHAVERRIAEAERLAQEVEFRGRGRGPDDQEPEKRAEADDEDGAVERELHPWHAHGGRADERDRREREHHIEGAVAHVRRPREGIHVMQPGNRGDGETEQVQAQRHREQ